MPSIPNREPDAPRPVIDLASIRRANQAEQRKAEAVACVAEHLDVIEAMVRPGTYELTPDERRQQLIRLRRQATEIVSAVLALTGGAQ